MSESVDRRYFTAEFFNRIVPIADWEVCLQSAHPGYIDWEEFMENQRRLANNINRYKAGHSGVPRKGAALLQGVAVCGRVRSPDEPTL